MAAATFCNRPGGRFGASRQLTRNEPLEEPRTNVYYQSAYFPTRAGSLGQEAIRVRLTIGMPMVNNRSTVLEAVRSVFAQTF